MLDKIISPEQLRMIVSVVGSFVMSVLTPTHNFIFALIFAAAFNIWAGMRADGVVIIRCRNFSFSKFKASLLELALYAFISCLLFTIMLLCGNPKEGVIVVRTMTYLFCYIYLQNALKNLVKAYPKQKAWILLYLIIRLEFARIVKIDEILDLYEKHEKGQQEIKI